MAGGRAHGDLHRGADILAHLPTNENVALSGHHLGLPVQRQVPRVFRHDSVGDESLCRKAALDQPGRSRRLNDAGGVVGAGSRGQVRAAGV